MTTIVDLLAAIGAHLAEFELPAIASVHVTAAMSTPQVTVQLDCRAPSVIAQGLLGGESVAVTGTAALLTAHAAIR